MEITPSTIYWIMQANDIKALFGVLTGLLVGAGVGCVIYAISEESERALKNFILFLTAAFLSASAALFVPSTRTLCAMYCIPKLINSELAVQLQGDAKELYTLGVDRLKKELKGETDGTKKP